MLPMKNHNRSLCTDKYITRSKYIGEVTISQYSWKPPAENREKKRNEMKDSKDSYPLAKPCSLS